MNRVALYLRVSTSDQSVDLQRRELLDYVAARGWTVVAQFADEGVSGAKDSRPELNKLMALAKRRGCDVIAVWRLDRFGRSLKHLVTALADLEALGVAFVSLRDGFDLSTPSGRLMFQIIGAMAEFERNLIRERSMAGQRTARAKAIRKLATELGHEPTQDDIRRHLNFGRPRTKIKPAQVMALRVQGRSYAVIARELKISQGLAHKLARMAQQSAG